MTNKGFTLKFGLHHFHKGLVFLKVLQTERLVVSIDFRKHLLHYLHEPVILDRTIFLLQFDGQGSATQFSTVETIKLSQLVDETIYDQFVKTLQKLRTQILVQKVDKP